MKKFKELSEALKKDSDDPCWKDYVQLGTKKKNGKEVPNCVPKEEVEIEEGNQGRDEKARALNDKNRLDRKKIEKGHKFAYSKPVKEEVEELDEAVHVDKKDYSWGRMVTVRHGNSHQFPLHPEHQDAIKKLSDGGKTRFKDETGTSITAHREGDKVHLKHPRVNKKTTVDYKHFSESVELDEATHTPEKILGSKPSQSIKSKDQWIKAAKGMGLVVKSPSTTPDGDNNSDMYLTAFDKQGNMKGTWYKTHGVFKESVELDEAKGKLVKNMRVKHIHNDRKGTVVKGGDKAGGRVEVEWDSGDTGVVAGKYLEPFKESVEESARERALTPSYGRRDTYRDKMKRGANDLKKQLARKRGEGKQLELKLEELEEMNLSAHSTANLKKVHDKYKDRQLSPSDGMKVKAVRRELMKRGVSLKERIDFDEAVDTASPDEASMAKKQAEYIEYVGRELGEYLEDNKEFPEWMQNKLSGLFEKAKDLHGNLGDHGEDEDEEEMTEEVAANSVSAGGVDMNPTGYTKRDKRRADDVEGMYRRNLGLTAIKKIMKELSAK